MPKYKCTVTDKSGNIHKKHFTSSGRVQLVSDLKRQGFIPVEITELEVKQGKRFSSQIISDFTSSLFLMMESGLSLKDSLAMSRNTLENNKTLQLTESLNNQLEKGLTFHSSLLETCSNLPPLYLGLIKIGERIGTLKQVLGELKAYLEEQKKFRDLMIGSLIYPMFVLVMVLIATILAAIFVIPGIQDVLLQIGSGSPELDQIILKIDRFRMFTLAFIPTVFILAILFILLRQTSRSFSRLLDKSLLHLPFVKKLITEQALYNMMYSLELLTISGIPLEEAIVETMNVIGNYGIKEELRVIREKILKGEKLSKAFQQSSIFPGRIGQWIAFGESTGHVEQIFGQLKGYYHNLIEKRLKLFMTMVEPAMIIAIGIIIIIFVMNIVLPVLTLYGSII